MHARTDYLFMYTTVRYMSAAHDNNGGGVLFYICIYILNLTFGKEWGEEPKQNNEKGGRAISMNAPTTN